MIKAIFYLGLAAVGIVAALLSPLAGLIGCISAYMLNPPVMELPDGGFRYQLFITVAFLIGFLLRRPAGAPRAGREGFVLVALWAFVALAALTGAWAVYSAQEAVDAAWETLKTVLVAALAVRAVRTEDDMSKVMLACIVGVWHAAFMHTFGIRWGYVPSRFGREYGVLPDGQTPVMVLFFPSLVVIAMLGRTKLERFAAWFTLPFALNSIVSSYMRTGFVSLLLEGVLLMLFLPKRITLRLAPAIVAVALLFVFRLTPEDYWQRVDTIKAPTEEASANSRFVIAGASIRMLQDHPMGVGYHNYSYVSPRYLDAEFLTQGRRSAHNSYFQVICDTGVAGFIIWMSAFLGALVLFRRIRKTTDPRRPSLNAVYAMGLEIGIYGWLAGGLFQGDSEVDPAYWFVAFAVILTRLHARAREAPPETEPQGETALEAAHQ